MAMLSASLLVPAAIAAVIAAGPVHAGSDAEAQAEPASLAAAPGDVASAVGEPEKLPEGQAGYFPDGSRAQPQPTGADPFAPPPNPVRFGLNLGLGTQIPIAGDTTLIDGRREFTGTFDLGGAFFVAIRNIVQLDLAARGGFGGLSSELYEERYRYTELRPRHLWVGGHARVFPFDLGGLQPFVSLQLGADRVFAARMEGTGVYECVDDGWSLRCEEEEARTFAAGYWGNSIGLGGGLRIGRAGGPVAFTAEATWMRNRYGVRTATGVPNDRLTQTAPITRNLGLLFLVHLHLN